MTGCALINHGVENIGFGILVVTMTFDPSAFKGICGTDAERVSVPDVIALSSLPKWSPLVLTAPSLPVG